MKNHMEVKKNREIEITWKSKLIERESLSLRLPGLLCLCTNLRYEASAKSLQRGIVKPSPCSESTSGESLFFFPYLCAEGL